MDDHGGSSDQEVPGKENAFADKHRKRQPWPPENRRKFHVTWKNADGSRSKFEMYICSDGSLLLKLPDYGPYHLHLGINRNGEGWIKFFLLFSDENTPEGDPDRHKDILQVGPFSASDFQKWKGWLISNVCILKPLFLKLLESTAELRALSDLEAEKWRPCLSFEELVFGEGSRNKPVKIDEEDFEAVLNESPCQGHPMLLSPDFHEPSGPTGLAVEMPNLDRDGLWKLIEETSRPREPSDEPTLFDNGFIVALNAWFRRQYGSLKEGPVYLVFNLRKAEPIISAISQWVLDGAIESFDDRGAKEWFRALKDEVARAFPEQEGINVEMILGFNPCDLTASNVHSLIARRQGVADKEKDS